MSGLFINICLFAAIFVTGSMALTMNPISKKARFDYNYSGSIDSSVQLIYTFQYVEFANNTQAFRVHVGSNEAKADFPLMIVVRQQRSILSWQIPLYLDYSYAYNEVSRTLCPVENDQKGSIDVNQTIYVEISTDSRMPVDYHLNATMLKDFELKMGQEFNISLTPSEPKFYEFEFPDDLESVRLVAESPQNSCMIMSVQPTHCPVFDLVRNVEFKGTHATVSKLGVITVERSVLKSFYVIFVLKPNDYPCTDKSLHIIPKSNQSEALFGKHPQFTSRVKDINFRIEKALDYSDYFIPVFGAVGFFLCFYLAAGLIALLYHFRNRRSSLQSIDSDAIYDYDPLLAEAPIAPAATEGSSEGSYGAIRNGPHRRELRDYSHSHLDCSDEEFDKLEDSAIDKDVLRTKKLLYVSDLSRKTHKHLTKKYRLYHWYLIIIAIFYGLPVIQLVITYQQVYRVTGNEDLCYYNFYCANPLGILTAFNNVISNIGYVMLGLLFLGLTARRDYMHRKAVELSETFQENHGIPQYFGLFYAVGIALVMEGILSACYHVCPNKSNFQFDTAFMYVLACLLMLKTYQTRHPDVNASAHAAYMMVAFIILIGVLGVFYGSMAFWIIFCLCIITASSILTVEIYYMGRWAMNLGMPRRILNLIRNDGFRCVQPMYRDRMILLLVINFVNYGLAIYGTIKQPIDFSSYLLSILMANLLMYFAFYIIMKLRSKERFQILPLLYVLIACVCWGCALYFFANHSTSWERTAADSRELNQKCILLNFYDVHDVWHFLSAMSLFFSFMVLLTLDDDLIYTPRNRIPVF